MSLRNLVTGSDGCTTSDAGPSNAAAALANAILGGTGKQQQQLAEVWAAEVPMWHQHACFMCCYVLLNMCGWSWCGGDSNLNLREHIQLQREGSTGSVARSINMHHPHTAAWHQQWRCWTIRIHTNTGTNTRSSSGSCSPWYVRMHTLQLSPSPPSPPMLMFHPPQPQGPSQACRACSQACPHPGL